MDNWSFFKTNQRLIIGQLISFDGFVMGSLRVSELKESLTRMGSDLKQGFISSLKSAWQTLNDFARAHTASAQLQAELAIVANQIEEQEKQAQEGEFLLLVILQSSHFCIL